MDLRVTDFRLVTTAILAVLAYANFFTHHWIPDPRWVIAAAFLGAWKYPDQLDVWRSVQMGKVGSWSLLVSLSFVLVAILKYVEGALFGHPGDKPTVEPHRRGD